ncbi:MAG TPA: helix-turn-helix transcriptional regulator [Bacteroidales bacterium]|nr:helix-turn-helix transcriptional regulator [Bacteroidales bacterium]
MIKNNKQLKNVQERIDAINEAIKNLDKTKRIGDDNLFELNKSALLSQLEDISNEVEFYTSIKDNKLNKLQIGSVENLHKALIAYRISIRWSQKDLAEKLGLKEQQIQRYEANDYQSASWHRILDIVSALGIEIEIKEILIHKVEFNLPKGINIKMLELLVSKVQEKGSLLNIGVN